MSNFSSSTSDFKPSSFPSVIFMALTNVSLELWCPLLLDLLSPGQSKVIYILYSRTKSKSLTERLPPSHSNHSLRSILGIALHGNNLGDCNSGNLNTSLDISVILSPLSQSTRAREACLIWVSFAGVNVDGLSYQNLRKS